VDKGWIRFGLEVGQQWRYERGKERVGETEVIKFLYCCSFSIVFFVAEERGVPRRQPHRRQA